MLADSARGLLAELAPVQHLRALRDDKKTYDPALWKTFAEMGWSGILVPEEVGGADMGHAAAGVLAGEMGKTLVASPFLSTAVIAASALRAVASEQAREALSLIADGSVTYALAIDEGRKFAPDNIKLMAEPSGNGFLLNGKKNFCCRRHSGGPTFSAGTKP